MEKTKKKKIVLGSLGPLLALIALIIVVTVLNPSFISPHNLLNLLRQVSINALMAFGMSFVILTGGIDLSVGSTLALSGAVTGGLIAGGTAPLFAMLAGMLLGALLGMINGLLVTKGRMAPFIATLATMTIYCGATLVYTGGNPVTGIGDSFIFQFMGKGYLFGIPFPVIVMLVLFLILYVLLHKTAFGKKTYAVG